MKLLIINGSPRQGSSTEILAEEFRLGFTSVLPTTTRTMVQLNKLDIIPCQACGINPSPLPCIYKDDLYPYLNELWEADMILIASPIYFDSVSAQTKLFIDRTNCLRPPIFENDTVSFDTCRLLQAKGAYILVGGDREKFDAAERVIGGMFAWTGIEKIGRLLYTHAHVGLGAAATDRTILKSAYNLGINGATAIQGSNQT